MKILNRDVKARSQPGPLGPPARCSDEERRDHGCIHHCKIVCFARQEECKSLTRKQLISIDF